MMEPTIELIDQLYREAVLRARQQTVAQRFLAGIELFHFACKYTVAGIQMQHPDANEETVRKLLIDRLALGRRLDAAV